VTNARLVFPSKISLPQYQRGGLFEINSPRFGNKVIACP
jgi:hypothetical protein